ncbi:2-dehydro-3-deoxygalactonokinase [Phenylobacterium sp. J426]|uniref:2-dehydro-3-deoxygalactonokinase n=1 Tax=Phenylobacterium sp. J426 TaxID=2898439 RepID=UPI002150BDE9|nr:2-dehydro-3-deoxygalactonokinase [Phenylobacterium sp. J426]MCR5876124.1 2-dehydro-3-deoxygalactonokinase [Phenylobacterium sp. J426]
MAAAVLACDWGTTNLRAWTLDAAGKVVGDRDFPGLGVSKLDPGEAEARFRDEVRPALAADGLPAILCGMVGSNLGWTLAPYADAPAGLDDLAQRLKAVEGPDWIRIVPGVRCGGFNGQGDVMRGEETQVFGWLAADRARCEGRRLVCHPGTHAKWMLVEDGRLTRFVTAMTGELFAVLKTHSVLKSEAPADDMAAFDAGTAAAGEGDGLAARLFTARARVVGEGRPAEETPSYLSGLLIGAEVASLPGLLGCRGDEPVSLLGDPQLCGLYARALAARGVSADVHDGEAAAIAGLFALYERARR